MFCYILYNVRGLKIAVKLAKNGRIIAILFEKA